MIRVMMVVLAFVAMIIWVSLGCGKCPDHPVTPAPAIEAPIEVEPVQPSISNIVMELIRIDKTQKEHVRVTNRIIREVGLKHPGIWEDHLIEKKKAEPGFFRRLFGAKKEKLNVDVKK